MNTAIDNQIAQLRAKYRVLVEHGDLNSAFRHLANLWCVVQVGSESLSLPVRESGRTFILEEANRLGEGVARQAIEKNVNSMRRIIDVGLDPIYEEVVLILTLRVEIELMTALAVAAFGCVIDDTLDLDSHLKDVLDSSAFRSVTRTAKASIKRNWGLPLRTHWIES